MSATGIGQRQTLSHDRVDLAAAEHLEQDAEVLPEPVLVANAQLLDPVGEHPPAG